MSKLLLIDGSSLLHRGYYAMPNLHNSQGEYTGGVYGLISMLSRIIAAEKPQYAAVCFDKSRKTFRNNIFAEYKGTRKPTPPELKSQFALAFELLDAFGVFAAEQDDYEADDLIGTLASQAAAQGLKVDIYTGDRDLLQLIDENITVHISGKTANETTAFTPEVMLEHYGFEPLRLIDFKALRGDTSDNIPGIAGVGEKTASMLLQQFGTLENLLAHTDGIANEKLRAKVEGGAEQARMSYELATICRKAPIEFDEKLMLLQPCHEQELLQLYRRLEFRSLLRPLEKAIAAKRSGAFFTEEQPPFADESSSAKNHADKTAEPAPAVKIDFSKIADEAALLKKLQGSARIGLYLAFEDAAIYGNITELGFGFEDGSCFELVFCGELDRCRLQSYKEILGNAAVEKLCYGLKDARLLLAAHGIKLRGAIWDAELAAYLLNNSKGEYPAETELYPDAALLAEGEKTAAFAASLFPVSRTQKERLAADGMLALYEKTEFPLTEVLFAMEREGVAVRAGELQRNSAELGERIDSLSADIYALAGCEFNINSPRQLGEVLFEKLGIQGGKKTKTGYSTAAEILEELAPQNEIIGKILDYRTCAKLRSTYSEGLQKLINPQNGRLHTSYKQTVTATGRLSSAEPNLQNIPVRYEDGKKLRKAFVPSQKGNILLAADYNQIELRVLAHISGDEKLIDAFRKNEDIHKRTAMEVFGVTEAEMTSELRRQAKAVNFGIVYGISDFGLAQDLGITRREAHDYIEKYFERYPRVREYQQQMIAQGREQGFVSTIFGRRRYLPELRAANFNVRSFAERMAINTPIQGTAADIIKMAMVELYRVLQEKGLRSKLILQVHDELILDVVPEEFGMLCTLLPDIMQNVVELAVPIPADIKFGENWYEMKKPQ